MRSRAEAYLTILLIAVNDPKEKLAICCLKLRDRTRIGSHHQSITPCG